jgi:uncharacterized protein YbjT (DUF2867 family)
MLISSRIAIVAGASGLVGSSLLRRLRDDYRYSHVIPLVRRPLGFDHPRLMEWRVDFDRLDQEQPIHCSDLFCALGTTRAKAGSRAAFRAVDFGMQLDVLEFALRSGATRCALVSTVGASPRSANDYLRVKGELEEVAVQLSFQALHIMRPSVLLGPRSERRPMEAAAQSLLPLVNPLLVGRYRQYRAVPAETVAAAMVAALNTPDVGHHVHHWPEIVQLAATPAPHGAGQLAGV